MSRHNRRRLRSGRKNRHQLQGWAGETGYDAPTSRMDIHHGPPDTSFYGLPSPRSSWTAAADDWSRGRATSTAFAPFPPHWSTPFLAAQAREAEKQRLFGESDGSGEDEGLCLKMLEFFGKLDFIDIDT